MPAIKEAAVSEKDSQNDQERDLAIFFCYPAKALSTSITNNIPDRDNPISLVVARSLMRRELSDAIKVPATVHTRLRSRADR
jgi:hypothetical protein